MTSYRLYRAPALPDPLWRNLPPGIRARLWADVPGVVGLDGEGAEAWAEAQGLEPLDELTVESFPGEFTIRDVMRAPGSLTEALRAIREARGDAPTHEAAVVGGGPLLP